MSNSFITERRSSNIRWVILILLCSWTVQDMKLILIVVAMDLFRLTDSLDLHNTSRRCTIGNRFEFNILTLIEYVPWLPTTPHQLPRTTNNNPTTKWSSAINSPPKLRPEMVHPTPSQPRRRPLATSRRCRRAVQRRPTRTAVGGSLRTRVISRVCTTARQNRSQWS